MVVLKEELLIILDLLDEDILGEVFEQDIIASVIQVK